MLDSVACLLVKALGALLCRLPPTWAIRLGYGLGWVISFTRAKRVQIGALNLLAGYQGELSATQARKLARRSFCQLIAGVFELLRLPVMDAEYARKYIHVADMKPFEQAVTSGRPIIMLTGHYGNWEMSSIKSALIGHPMVVLARSQANFPKLYALLVSYRESKGNRVAHKGNSLRLLIRALSEQNMVGIVGDQASKTGVPITFFGREAFFAKGPYTLAYDKNAIILPAFIRRERGAQHRIYFEPLIDVTQCDSRDQAVQKGVEAFALGLEKQVREAPEQWLWMHKRWKHTASKRVLVLSDEKMGHQKQSLVVWETIRRQHPLCTQQLVTVQYRSSVWRVLAILFSAVMPIGWIPKFLQWGLTPESGQALLSQYADAIISCGSMCAPINVLWGRFNRAKKIVLMNPAPIATKHFDLVIAPVHDRIGAHKEVVETQGALAWIDLEEMKRAAGQLQKHVKFTEKANDDWKTRPKVAVFLGGDTADYTFTMAFVKDMIEQILCVCDKVQGHLLLTTSRRTPEHITQFLKRQLESHERCLFFLDASTDSLEGTFLGMLGMTDVAVVTGESISMVSEACSSGKQVVTLQPPLKNSKETLSLRHQVFLQNLHQKGYMKMAPLSELGHDVERALQKSEPAKKLNDLEVVQTAVRQIF